MSVSNSTGSNGNKPKKNFNLALITTQENIRLSDAVYQGDVKLASAMLNSDFADVNYCDQDGNCLLKVAILARDPAMVKLLLKFRPTLSAKDTTKCSPIWLAALTGEDEIVSLLVQAGADVNERLNVCYAWNEMCPHEKGMSLLHLAVAQKNVAKVKLLLDYGADIDALDQNNISPLQAALQLQNAQIAKILLEKGALIDSQNRRGETILQSALIFGNKELISIILSLNPKLKVVDRHGRNNLHYLSQSTTENLEIAQYLLKKGDSVNQTDNHCGVTPLHVAIMSNKSELIKLYLKNGADVNLNITCGYSPLNLAAVCCSANIVRLLLKKGANANSITETGETALHRVCRQNSVEKIEALLEYGADVNIKGKSGKTAIESLRYFHMSASKSLIKHIVKMESLNLFVDENILHFIRSNHLLKQYRESCLEELQNMKNEKFYNNFSFYYVLSRSIETLHKLAANEEFTDNFKLFDVASMFPWYGKEVVINFKKAERKMKACKQLTDHLSLVFYHRYDSIIQFIAKYLKPTDIPLTLA